MMWCMAQPNGHQGTLSKNNSTVKKCKQKVKQLVKRNNSKEDSSAFFKKDSHMEDHTIVQSKGLQPRRSSLHTAAYDGDVAQVMDLLQRGSQVSSPSRLPSDNGKHALHLATSEGHESTVGALLEKGADPDACDHQGFRPLHIAAQRGFLKVVDLLKDSGGKLEAQTKLGLQAVHLAAGNGQVPMLKQLQKYRCDLAVPDFSWATPLHHAAQRGKLEAVQWLVEAGVSLDLKDEEGKTAIDRAKENEYYEVAEFLTSKKAKKGLHQRAASDPITIPRIPPSPTTSPSTEPPQHTGAQDSQPVQTSSPRQVSKPPHQSNGICSPTPDMAKSTATTTHSSPPRFPFDTHPSSSSSNGTSVSSVLSGTSPLQVHIPDSSIPSSSTILPSPSSQSDLSPSTASDATSSTSTQSKKKLTVHPLLGCLCDCKLEPEQDRSTTWYVHGCLLPASIEPGKKVVSPEPDGYGLGQGHGGGQSEELTPQSPPLKQSQQDAPVMDLQVQSAARPHPEGPDAYSCCTNPRGLVLILNNKSFKNSHHLTRLGSECDTINLENVFQQMGYQVQTRWDLSRQDTLDYFSEVSKSPILRHVSCIFVFIMSHGNGPRSFMTYDEATVSLDEIQSYFLDQACPSLQGRPKVFFSHFCRGSDEEIRPMLFPEAKREAYRDMLCIYSSTEGFQAYRHAKLGTPSVRALCQTLALHAHDKKLCEVIRKFQLLYETMEGATSPEVQNFSFDKDFFLNPIGK